MTPGLGWLEIIYAPAYNLGNTIDNNMARDLPKNSLSLQNSENNMTATPHPPPKKSVKITCSFSMWNSFNVTAHRAAGVRLRHGYSGSVYLLLRALSQLFLTIVLDSQLWVIMFVFKYIKPFYSITIPYYFTTISQLFCNYGILFESIANYFITVWNNLKLLETNS